MCNHQKDVFAISLMDTVYTKREEAGKALLGLLGMAMNRTEPVSIGQYKGFDLQIAYFAMDKMYLAYLVGNGINPVQLGADAVGNTMRLDNCLHNLPQSVTDLESKLVQLQKQLENAKEQLAQPFAQADELAEKSKRLAELEALLNLNEKILCWIPCRTKINSVVRTIDSVDKKGRRFYYERKKKQPGQRWPPRKELSR